MKKRIISLAFSLAMLSSLITIPSLSAMDTEETQTYGIEQTYKPSKTKLYLEISSFEDLLAAFEKDSYVYRYSNNTKAFVVTADGKLHHFSDGCLKNSKFSVVTMHEGMVPPVKEINEKIGANDDQKVVFYKYADSDEYRFDVANDEYRDIILDILKNDENVISVENRLEIKEDNTGIIFLNVSSDCTAEEFKNEYNSFDLQQVESLESEKLNQGYNLGFWFGIKNRSFELYEDFIKLNNSGIKYELVPFSSLVEGYNVCYELVTEVNVATEGIDEVCIGDINVDGKIDITDLSELSLILVDNKTLTDEQFNSADLDGDGNVTLADLARLKQYLSKVITSL